MFSVNFSMIILGMAHLIPKQNPNCVFIGISSNVCHNDSVLLGKNIAYIFICSSLLYPSVELKLFSSHRLCIIIVKFIPRNFFLLLCKWSLLL